MAADCLFCYEPKHILFDIVIYHLYNNVSQTLLICIYPVSVTVSATDSGYVVDDFWYIS